jgi:beta-galactosidase
MMAAAAQTNVAIARETINIGAGWTFFTASDPSTDNASVVNLPHTQSAIGTVNYLKQIDIPAAWSGKKVFLRIGGAARVADVFVNDNHVASHRGGNSAFTIDITDRLSWGTPAAVRIVVSNARGLGVMPTAGGEKIYGGLFRNVELIVCEPLSISPNATLTATGGGAGGAGVLGVSGGVSTGGGIMGGGDGVWITTDKLTREKAEGKVRLKLLSPSIIPAGALARVRFSDADGMLVAQNTMPVNSSDLSIPFTLSAPNLWQGVSNPYLYTVEVTITTADGTIIDSMDVTTGFRTVAVDGGNNLTLNGIPTRIHGVILPRDRMMVGTALTPFQIEEDVNLILEMGANAVRVTGGQHNDYFYTLCDEVGLLVWNDGPFTGAAYPTDIDFVDTEAFKNSGRQQITEMISEIYNHPSVVAWGVFSNVATRSSALIPYVRELNSLVHRLDPHRLTACSSVQDGELNFITDITSFDLSLGWQTGLPDGVVVWLRQLKNGWPNLRAGVSYSAGGSIFHQSERLERPSPTGNYHPEGWQTFFHEEYMKYAVNAPGLWGVFVGNMFDSGAAKSSSGTLSTAAATTSAGGIDDRGVVTFDRKDRKDAFWLYKANWNSSESFVRIAGSRLDNRVERRQTIRAYSNLPEVELFMGGRSQGRRTGNNGIFVWENIAMRPGMNRLEARAVGTNGAAGANDRASITISNVAATYSQPAPTGESGVASPVAGASGVPSTAGSMGNAPVGSILGGGASTTSTTLTTSSTSATPAVDSLEL